jgi:hypothetical protein
MHSRASGLLVIQAPRAAVRRLHVQLRGVVVARPQGVQSASDSDLDGSPSAARPPLPLYAIPWLVVALDGLCVLPLDARSAYLLSLVDGQCSVELILDICQTEVGREEARGALAELLWLGAIELRDP